MLLSCCGTSFGGICLPYEPAKIKLECTVVRKDYPGRPNFESITDGDEKLAYWILMLDKPACVGSGKAVGVNEPEANISEVQLAFRDAQLYKKYRQVVGKHVSVSGVLFHQHSAWHVTRVVVHVSDLKYKP